MSETNKLLLKKVWEQYSFDEIIDAGFDYNKCGAMHLLKAAEEFKDKNNLDNTTFLDSLSELLETHERNLPWAREVMELLVGYYSESQLMDYFDESDLIDHLDGTWQMDEYIKEHAQEDVVEEIESRKTTKYDILNAISNLNRYDFKRFLCDIVSMHYCVSEDKLIEEIKLKLIN
jgi:hypothetical protein